MKTLFKKYELTVAATATNYDTDALDISAYSGFSVQVVGPGGGTGNALCLVSNDSTNFAQLSTTAIAAGQAIVNNTSVMYQHLKVRVNVSAGTGTYSV